MSSSRIEASGGKALSTVTFAEILAAPSREKGAGIPPYWPGKVSLERERRHKPPSVAGIVSPSLPFNLAYTVVTLGP
jgi:hypothetical protein